MLCLTSGPQIAASLVICDLLVIVTYFHRVLKSEDLELAQDYDLSSSVYLTTMVDFGRSTTSASYLSHAVSASLNESGNV